MVTRTCALAGRGGQLEVLQWARENDCPWDRGDVVHLPLSAGAWTCYNGHESTTARVTGRRVHGHLNMLMWAREHNCPWDEDTGEYAATGGQLEVLQWAREYGCPWDNASCIANAHANRHHQGGAAEVETWLLEQ
jgi:hypothetical protein